MLIQLAFPECSSEERGMLIWCEECSGTEAVSFTARLVSSVSGELFVTHPVRNARYLLSKMIKAFAAF